MHCPDCGRRHRDGEACCPDCGYPLAALEKRLQEEEQEALGWAEKLLGKPRTETAPPVEIPLTSFATGREEPPKILEKSRHRCERCGAAVDLGVACPMCGDKLPSLMENDPYIILVLRGLWRMIVAPKEFALSFPYPISGGILQPLLYPGISAALLVFTLPLLRPEALIEVTDPTRTVIPALIGYLASIVLVPVLVYVSAWIIDLVGKLLGSTVPLRRTIRIAGAYIFWLLILGMLYHFVVFGVYEAQAHVAGRERDAAWIVNLYRTLEREYQWILGALLLLFGWIFAWAFGGLFRLSWWKSLILLISTYCFLVPAWIFLLVIFPLHAAGLL